MPVTSAVILAAGLGTRMKSKLAKVLHRAGGACLLEHVIDAARGVADSPANIVAVVGHQAERVQAAVASTGIGFATQTEQRGTGHALLCAKDHPSLQSGRIVVMYGDCPLLTPETLQGLVRRHDEARAAATLIVTTLDNPYGYGRIFRDEQGYVASIVEEKAATPEQKKLKEINSGIYCFEAAILWRYLPQLAPNPASGELYLTDAVELLRAHGHFTASFEVNDPSQILGINSRLELAEVDGMFRARKVRELMIAGVTIEKPETVTIDRFVEVGPDSVVGPFVQLTGRTKLGENSTIGACSILDNVDGGDGVVVHPFSHIADSRLDDGVHAGPYARIRMNSHVEAGAHVGNFVELKKTRLGKGSKAMHLAYLGDSSIGAKANIGAGTITCNYDGLKKHPTTIGDGAFVGSNSTLVAPVTIGDNAYTAAGSVITHEVPADALAFGRARQTNKEGYAKQLRELKKKS
jgi:bifunctional UDP-N-acetylglucosamine pyrophosphorylase/glucosamine-1-phosphate N-acetyltransferase